MAHISVDDANAWLEATKLDLTASDLDADLELQVSTQILNRLGIVFDVSGWSTRETTPRLVRSIIAMEYVAWVYDKTYADNEDANSYAALLRQHVEANITGLMAGNITLPEVDPNPAQDTSEPVFFPNDASSANEPSMDFPSDGPPAFMMGTVF